MDSKYTRTVAIKPALAYDTSPVIATQILDTVDLGVIESEAPTLTQSAENASKPKSTLDKVKDSLASAKDKIIKLAKNPFTYVVILAFGVIIYVMKGNKKTNKIFKFKKR